MKNKRQFSTPKEIKHRRAMVKAWIAKETTAITDAELAIRYFKMTGRKFARNAIYLDRKALGIPPIWTRCGHYKVKRDTKYWKQYEKLRKAKWQMIARIVASEKEALIDSQIAATYRKRTGKHIDVEGVRRIRVALGIPSYWIRRKK